MTENNPSGFTVMGAFNDYYNKDNNLPSSLSLATDFGKSVPANARKDVVSTLTKPVTSVTPAPTPTAMPSGLTSSLHRHQVAIHFLLKFLMVWKRLTTFQPKQ